MFEKRITDLFSEFDDVHWRVSQDMWCSLSITMRNDLRQLTASIYYEWSHFEEAANALLDLIIIGSCTEDPMHHYWGQNVEVIMSLGDNSLGPDV